MTSKTSEPPWATGPGEIIRHGIELLEEGSDPKRRLALIAIDNSVELMVRTFIELPSRITGVKISRKEQGEITSNFSTLIDGLEKHAPEKVGGLDLGEIEWFHRLRNQLYHGGNGLTVERQKVEVYAELASILFEQIFDAKLQLNAPSRMDRLGSFMSNWNRVTKQIQRLTETAHLPPLASASLRQLDVNNRIGSDNIETLKRLQLIRNSVVHGVGNQQELLSNEALSEVEELADRLEGLKSP